ncbi:uncharacterized protein SCODWIG_00220 [Saccharomycodes ludwigii]|uniref:RING-CH-type domain-containing protein n=1 Tax=Saccharomycodes ludwigii TaxID=36035 RepID=A0A376B1G5_9ASCO|nr:hypothetical protein SCDLUD_001159 [Saccharomycodes ludwigii]KAH3903518.1 hypothetical protein SCDLUD_001159 [Saccharomycodes ludwigii]SSD58459.1 uncharacterized protein SCODWIG_00220 [Saccharomycodes ludwigii]
MAIRDDDCCWICYNDKDHPPKSILRPSKNPEEDWVKCKCSLRAHKACIFLYVSKKLQEGNLMKFSKVLFHDNKISPGLGVMSFNLWPLRGFSQKNKYNELSTMIMTKFHLIKRDVNGKYSKAMLFGSKQELFLPSKNVNVSDFFTECPQCKAPIIYEVCQSSIGRIASSINRTCSIALKFIWGNILVSSVISSAIFTVSTTMIFWGFDILNMMAPKSTLMKIMNLENYSTLNDALNNDALSSSHVLLFSSIPLFLCSINHLIPLKEFECSLLSSIPFLLLSTVFNNTNKKHPSNWLRYITFITMGYRCFYSFVINPIHRKYFTFLQNGTSDNESDNIENGILFGYKPRSIMSKFYSFIASKINYIKNLIDHDYYFESNADPLWLRLVETIALPYLGVYFNKKYLLRSSFIKDWISKITQTPDDALFVGNICGCVCVSLMKTISRVIYSIREMTIMKNNKIYTAGSPFIMEFEAECVGARLGFVEKLDEDDLDSLYVISSMAQQFLSERYYKEWITFVTPTFKPIKESKKMLQNLLVKSYIDHNLDSMD